MTRTAALTAWNESKPSRDSATGRPVRQLTTRGLANNTPSYQQGSTFSADGRYLLVLSIREGRSCVLRAEAATGELTELMSAEGFGEAVKDEMEPWAPGPEGRGGIHHVTMLPASGWAVAVTPRRVLAAHVETGEQRVLVPELDPGEVCSMLGGNASGDKVYLPMSPIHPDLAAGHDHPRRGYTPALLEAFGGKPSRLLEVDLSDGRTRCVDQHDFAGNNHVIPSPVDDDLLLIDRDLPPTFGYYGDLCESPRAHLLRLSTGELTPLRPRNRHQFQSHTNWNRDGSRVYYHGPAYEGHEQPVREGGRLGEMFLGVSDLAGQCLWEMNFPDYFWFFRV